MKAKARASLIIFIFAQQLLSPALGQEASVFPAANGVIFPGQKALTLVHGCRGEYPKGVNGTWTPTASQIADLEKNLPESFRVARKAWAQMIRGLKTNLRPEDVDRNPAPFFRQ